MTFEEFNSLLDGTGNRAYVELVEFRQTEPKKYAEYKKRVIFEQHQKNNDHEYTQFLLDNLKD